MNANDDLPSYVRWLPFGQGGGDPRTLMKARLDQMRREQQQQQTPGPASPDNPR